MEAEAAVVVDNNVDLREQVIGDFRGRACGPRTGDYPRLAD
jgi:hypothetical protein